MIFKVLKNTKKLFEGGEKMKKTKHHIQKRIFSLFLATILVLAPLSSIHALEVEDIAGHWAREVITDWLSEGLAQGYPDGNFKPDSPINRAEFIALINKAFDFTEGEENTFLDIQETDWYSDAIKVAIAAGYIGGYPDGTMKPKESITRQEVAIIISKITNLENNPSQSSNFKDSSTIPEWSIGQIGAVVEAGYMSGYPDGSFRPLNPITRAEALVTLNRALADEDLEAEIEEEVLPEALPQRPSSGGGGGQSGGGTTTVAISAMSVTPETMNLTVGEATGEIIVTVSPNNATNKNIIWASDNEAVAVVIGGVITPIAEGTATITATSVADGTKSATCVVTVNAAGPEPTTEFASGTGTWENPWMIETADQLNNIRNYLDVGNQNKYFELANDIDLGQSPWDEGAGWEPIGGTATDGTLSKAFYGQFEGNNHTIRGLTITRPTEDYIGLFGITEGTNVRNLNLTNVDIEGSSYVGSLVGYSSNGSVDAITASGSLSGSGYVGGLVGFNYNKAIQNCHVDVDVYSTSSNIGGLVGGSNKGGVVLSSALGHVVGNNHVGGLVGSHGYGSYISKSYFGGSVEGHNHVGGLVGKFEYAYGNSISDAYVTGTVEGNGYVGGLAGGIFNESHIERSYAVGQVNGNDDLGGLVGSYLESQVNNSYWDKESTGRTTSANSDHSFGITTEAMQKEETFVGWDFDTVWAIDEDTTYPYLIDNQQDPKPFPEVTTEVVTGVSIPEGNQFINEEGSIQLTADVSPINATNKSVSWASDDHTVATVNDFGVVTGISEGTAIITVTTDDGDFTDSITITVSNYLYDFEANDGGFIVIGTSDVWAWGVPVTWPGNASSGSNCWGTNLLGNYPNFTQSAISSPQIDLSGYTAGDVIEIRWWQALHMETAGFDQAFAEIRKPDGTIEVMWAHAGSTVQDNWAQRTYEMTIPDEGMNWIQLQFRISTDSSINHSGYYIDDISIIKK